MLLNLSDLSPEPLHRQISRQLRARILAGRLEAGTSLPSIRVLAREQHVSVITVQRAYDDLERSGLVQARRGKGFFVAEVAAADRLRMAEERAAGSFQEAVTEALAEGLDAGQIRALVAEILEREDEER